MSDPVSRVLLGVVAVALCVIALRSVPPAQAVDAVTCRIEGPVEVRLTEIRGPIAVETQPKYGVVGSSSGNPLHVRMGD